MSEKEPRARKKKAGMKSVDRRKWWDNFQKLLDEDNDWPGEYLFKFIVPSSQVDEVERLFNRLPVQVKESSRGNYMSVTARVNVQSSDEVIAIYTAAAEIEGIILL